jgi:hypothetical protein
LNPNIRNTTLPNLFPLLTVIGEDPLVALCGGKVIMSPLGKVEMSP